MAIALRRIWSVGRRDRGTLVDRFFSACWEFPPNHQASDNRDDAWDAGKPLAFIHGEPEFGSCEHREACDALVFANELVRVVSMPDAHEHFLRVVEMSIAVAGTDLDAFQVAAAHFEDWRRSWPSITLAKTSAMMVTGSPYVASAADLFYIRAWSVPLKQSLRPVNPDTMPNWLYQCGKASFLVAPHRPVQDLQDQVGAVSSGGYLCPLASAPWGPVAPERWPDSALPRIPEWAPLVRELRVVS